MDLPIRSMGMVWDTGFFWGVNFQKDRKNSPILTTFPVHAPGKELLDMGLLSVIITLHLKGVTMNQSGAYLLGPNDENQGVYTGDCLELFCTIDDNSIDAIITDPPYFLPAQHYATRKRFPRSLSDLSMLEHFYRDWFAGCVRILKPSGVFYIFCDGQSYPVFFALAYPHVKSVRPLIWDKIISFNGFSWRHQHELILFAEMDKAPSIPTGDGDIIRHRAVKVNDRTHPAEKPVGLLTTLMQKSLARDAIVVDPFAGSGSTGEAAILSGVHYLCFERDEQYAINARERLQGIQPSLFVPELRQVALFE